jgi:hypothetical protein
MAHLGRHPAPGLGELIPGWFSVPSNPIIPPTYIPHIGELLPASFPIPQNPLIAAVMSPPGYGLPNQSGLGCGCAPGCGSGMCGGAQGMAGLSGDCGCIGGMCGCGMGQFADPMSLALLAGGVILLLWLWTPGGREHREAQARLLKTYQRQSAYLKAKARGYRRVARKVTGVVAQGALAAKQAIEPSR